MIDAFIHKQKQLFLAFRLQTMHLIQKQNTALCQLDQTGIIPVSSGKRPFFVTKQVGSQQLRIVRIFTAVYNQKISILRYQSLIYCILIHKLRQKAFSGSCRSIQQKWKTGGRIGYRRLTLIYQRSQTFIIANQLLKILRLMRLQRFLKFLKGNEFTLMQ